MSYERHEALKTSSCLIWILGGGKQKYFGVSEYCLKGNLFPRQTHGL